MEVEKVKEISTHDDDYTHRTALGEHKPDPGAVLVIRGFLQFYVSAVVDETRQTLPVCVESCRWNAVRGGAP
jgi:hypothetical protein